MFSYFRDWHFGFAVLLPFFMGANIAFTDWNGISSDYNYVWFDNFLHILEDAKNKSTIFEFI